MPSKSRREIIDPDVVGIYHVYNQIVDQQFLLGYDPRTGKDFGYRRDWIYDRLKMQARYFAIDVFDFAILGNHFHLMVRNRPEIVEAWTDEEVVRRWLHICPVCRDRLGRPKPPTDRQVKKRLGEAKQYRERLASISWFMRLLSQKVAMRANKEDGRKGHFFAGRFKSERLETEHDLLQCSLYIDLNIVRAGLADCPEKSKYTSAFDRIRSRWNRSMTDLEQQQRLPDEESPDAWLAPVYCPERADDYTGPVQLVTAAAAVEASQTEPQKKASPAKRTATSSTSVTPNVNTYNPLGAPRVSNKGFLPMKQAAYLQLLDIVGRIARPDKKGSIPSHLPPLYKRLNLTPQEIVARFNELDRTLPPDRTKPPPQTESLSVN